MTDEPHNLILDHLRQIQTVLADHGRDLREIKERLTRVELGLAAVRREVAGLAETDATIQAHVDRFGDRMSRIARRLEIDEAMSPLPLI